MSAVILSIAGLTADDNGVSESQTVPAKATGNSGVGVVIDGAYASGYSANSLATAAAGVTTATLTAAAASIVPPRQIVIVSSGNESAKTVAITGVLADGRTGFTETITGPNASRTATVNFFTQVTSVVVSSASAGNLSVGVNGYATITQPRRIALTSGGVDTGITFAVSGTDVNGSAISETVTGASTAAAYTVLAYKTVTGIVASGATAGTLIVGSAADSITGGAAYSMILYPDQFLNPFNVGIGAKVTSGTATFSVQHTFDDINSVADLVSASWADNTGISAKTASDNLVSGNYAYPVSGIRIMLTSGTGTVKAWIRQAGSR